MKKKRLVLLSLLAVFILSFMSITANAKSAKSKALTAYKKYLQKIEDRLISEGNGEDSYFMLAYLDNDSVPELIVKEYDWYDCEYRTTFYNFRNNKVRETPFKDSMNYPSETELSQDIRDLRYYQKTGIIKVYAHGINCCALEWYQINSGKTKYKLFAQSAETSKKFFGTIGKKDFTRESSFNSKIKSLTKGNKEKKFNAFKKNTLKNRNKYLK